ncbi:MAG: hypothetical protein SVR08_05590 [Spirochaetota bacterium]|nr:hypothetical protein [Spirochaetota bacterium]
MIKGIINKIQIFFFIALISISIFGCKKQKGEFAFKSYLDETYKKMSGIPEFNIREKINWVYIFNQVNDIHNINVVLLMKEAIWVDVNTRTEKITPMNKIIYGEIKNLEQGKYRILLSEGGRVIDKKEFIIYNTDEE